MSRAALILALLAAGEARAAEGDPIRSHRFDLDVFHGPVIASGRILSLSGAYVGIAEGVDGLFYNPAAVANRYPFSLDWWDWDVDVGFVFPTAIGNLDFDNDGVVQHYDSALSATIGGSLQFGRLGLGFETSALGYGLTVEDAAGEPVTTHVDVSLVHVDVAYGFLGGGLLVGLGVRAGGLEVTDVGEISGAGLEAGVLVRPDRRPLRIGASIRTEFRSTENTLLDPDGRISDARCDATAPVGGLFVPCHVVVPWEASVGGSWRFGRAAYNEPWVNPREERARIEERAQAAAARRLARDRRAIAALPPEARAAESERLAIERQRLQDEEVAAGRRAMREADRARRAAYQARARKYLLVSASLTVTGPSPNALGIEAFLLQTEIHSGKDASLTPALGLETEVWSNVLKLRAGSYLEPTRFEDSETRDAEPRLHGTAGVDVRLFEWDVFGIFSPFWLKAGSTIDLAPNWLNFGVGVGIWH